MRWQLPAVLALLIVTSACQTTPAKRDRQNLSPQLGRGTFRVNVILPNNSEGAVVAYAWRPADISATERSEFWLLTAAWPEPRPGTHPRLKFHAVDTNDADLAAGAMPFDHTSYENFYAWTAGKVGGEDNIKKAYGHSITVLKDIS